MGERQGRRRTCREMDGFRFLDVVRLELVVARFCLFDYWFDRRK